MPKQKKYKKVVINASFEELVKESVSGNPKPEPKKMSPDKKIKALRVVHNYLLRKGKKN